MNYDANGTCKEWKTLHIVIVGYWKGWPQTHFKRILNDNSPHKRFFFLVAMTFSDR